MSFGKTGSLLPAVANPRSMQRRSRQMRLRASCADKDDQIASPVAKAGNPLQPCPLYEADAILCAARARFATLAVAFDRHCIPATTPAGRKASLAAAANQ